MIEYILIFICLSMIAVSFYVVKMKPSEREKICEDHKVFKHDVPPLHPIAELPLVCEVCEKSTEQALFYGSRICPTCLVTVDLITRVEDQ